MYYATIKDGKVDKFGHFSKVFPNVSFPQDGIDPEWIKEQNAQEMIMTLDHDETKQKVVLCDPYIGKDAKVYGVEIVDYTKEEAAAYAKALKDDIKLHAGVKDAE